MRQPLWSVQAYEAKIDGVEFSFDGTRVAEQIESYAKDLDSVNRGGNFTKVVKRVIEVGPHHEHCSQEYSCGPAESELTKTPITGVNKDKLVSDMNDKALVDTKIGKNASPNTVLQRFRKRYDEDERSTVAELNEAEGVWISEALDGGVGGSLEAAEGMDSLEAMGNSRGRRLKSGMQN